MFFFFFVQIGIIVILKGNKQHPYVLSLSLSYKHILIYSKILYRFYIVSTVFSKNVY